MPLKIEVKNEKCKVKKSELALMYENEKSILFIKSKCFASRILKMTKHLYSEHHKIFATDYNQVHRSGTSIMANVSESQFAQSPADFVHKLQIALKEANETLSWLQTLHSNDCLTVAEFKSMESDCRELIALLVSSVKISKRNQQIIIK